MKKNVGKLAVKIGLMLYQQIGSYGNDDSIHALKLPYLYPMYFNLIDSALPLMN